MMKLLLLPFALCSVLGDSRSPYDFYGGGGGYNRLRYSSQRSPGYGYGSVPTGSYAVKRNYGGYGQGGYQRGGSLDYAQSYNCRRSRGYGYAAQLWCGEGYDGFACSLEGVAGGYAHGRGGAYGGRRHHHRRHHGRHGGYRRSYNFGYRRGSYGDYGGEYRRRKRSIAYGPSASPGYGSQTCWRQDGKKLSCEQVYSGGYGGYGGYGGGYGGNYKCTARGSKHYGSYSYQTQGGHGGYGHAAGGYGGHGSRGSRGLRGAHGHFGRHGHFNPQYGGRNYHLGIPFGLKDVEKEGKSDTDKNANKCKKECWINRHGKQNCKIKCCNWQCPQVCTSEDCCDQVFPVPESPAQPPTAEEQAAIDANAKCLAELMVNRMSCRFSCYVKMENLDQKEGKYHVSETYGRYQNARQNAVKNAFVGYAEFYKDPNEDNHLKTSQLLTDDAIDGEFILENKK